MAEFHTHIMHSSNATATAHASSTQPTTGTGVTNHFRLHYLVNGVASRFLRNIFCDLWLAHSHRAWTNKEQDAQALITGVAEGLYTSSQRIQKRLLKEGNCENWDLPLLIDVVKALKVTESGIQLSKLDRLREIRNQIAHSGNATMKDENFDQLWLKASSLMRDLGIEQSEIDEARALKLNCEGEGPNLTSTAPLQMQSSTVTLEEYKKLKDEGNEFYRKKEYAKAIQSYTEGIALEGVSRKELAVLYSNRSAANLSNGMVDEAKFDAKSCTTLNPVWFRGYHRLAKSYEILQKFDKALGHYEISLSLKPDSGETLEARDYCRIMVAKQEREDHLDPLLQVHSREDLNEGMKKLGVKLLPGMEDATTKHFLDGLPVGICGEAHKYVHGLDGYKVDFQEAAKLFAIAAKKGSAEGLYNLAILTREGKGVARDLQKGRQLLLQAASQEPKVEALPGSGVLITNLGVAEAQHGLGLDCENGITVAANCSMALEWYDKALKNGSGFSANNIACIYSSGRAGTFPNLTKALLYWKVGALKGTVRCSENLASTYLQFGKLELARDWCLFGIHGGSSVLQWQKQDYNIQVAHEASFDAAEFERKLKEELLHSELKHLATTHLDDMGNQDLMHRFSELSTCPSGNDKHVVLIKGIRTAINSERGSKGNQREWTAGAGSLVPKVDVDLIGLKPIKLKEFDETIGDKVYSGFILKVVVVEDAHVRPSSIYLLAQDEDGGVERVFIYGWPRNGKIQQEIGYGSVFSIVNPYFRKMKDGFFAIRVDDINTIFRHAALSDPKRCRYCGKSNSPLPCRKCKRVYYCDKLCMKRDGKEREHQLVCFKTISG